MSPRYDALSVLVIDDHKFMQQILRMSLTGIGVKTVVCAGDAEEGLLCLHSEQFDFVIVDYRLGDHSGAWFTRLARLSSESAKQFVPIIACTADTTTEVIKELQDAGVDEILAKPLSTTALWLRIKAVIDKRRSFVRVEGFFGPDRRRRAPGIQPGVERRKKFSN